MTNKLLRQSPDGSILDEHGRIILFSKERFLADICDGDSCFVCGVARTQATFTDEHVFPQWLLREFDLHGRMLTLPNGTDIRYDQYRIPCCASCNGLLGARLEDPIAQAFANGFAGVDALLKELGPWPLFIWLASIFLKVHLKDRALRLNRDLRTADSRIADLYSWEDFFHIHSVVRSIYTSSILESKVLGSLFVLPAQNIAGIEEFDYGDLYAPQSILLRVRDVAIVAVLTDACAGFSVLPPLLEKITAPLSPLQLREMMVRLADVKLRLKVRPVFLSLLDFSTGAHTIRAETPVHVELHPPNPEAFGALLDSACGAIVEKAEADSARAKEIRQNVRAGKWTFLFDDQGDFLANQLRRADKAEHQDMGRIR